MFHQIHLIRYHNYSLLNNLSSSVTNKNASTKRDQIIRRFRTISAQRFCSSKEFIQNKLHETSDNISNVNANLLSNPFSLYLCIFLPQVFMSSWTWTWTFFGDQIRSWNWNKMWNWTYQHLVNYFHQSFYCTIASRNNQRYVSDSRLMLCTF